MWWVAACTPYVFPGLPDTDGPDPDRPTADTSTWPFAPTASTAETGHTGSQTGATADTGTGPPYPPCDHVAQKGTVRFTGDEAGDFAGRYVDAADMDADGCAEVMVAEPWSRGSYYVGGVHSAVHLLQEPWVAGRLRDVAWSSIIGGGYNNGLDDWGQPSVLMPELALVAIRGWGYPGEAHRELHMFRWPTSQPSGVVHSMDRDAAMVWDPADRALGGESASPCARSDGQASFCYQAIHRGEGFTDWAGRVLLFDAPLVGDVAADTARASYAGDPGDHARVVDGRSDFDGDGVRDLAIGAYYHQGTGAVAIILAPPDGNHDIWDVADAKITGVEVSSQFGFALAGGDLDGDGSMDLFASAPFEGTGGVAYVIQGPLGGTQSASTAAWTVSGTQSGQWLGYDGGFGDVHGDGQQDWVLGAPFSASAPDVPPGSVRVFPNPAPGTYDDTDAAIVLTGGAIEPDAFGMALAVADIDGDGRDDVVVGAPRDPEVGVDGGSVTLFFGAGL